MNKNPIPTKLVNEIGEAFLGETAKYVYSLPEQITDAIANVVEKRKVS